MSRRWDDWKKYWDDTDEWQYPYEESKSGRKQIKKVAVAALLFALIYGMQLLQPQTGIPVGEHMQKILSEETDFHSYMAAMKERMPGWDNQTFQRVQSVLGQPADPLAYMSAPVEAKADSFFGWHTDEKSGREYLLDGVEYRVPIGTEVKACCVGKVKTIADTAQKGRVVVLEHGKDVETVYGYLSEVSVAEGERVTQGQVIAKTGKKVKTDVPMLYFEVREKGIAVDPLQKLR